MLADNVYCFNDPDTLYTQRAYELLQLARPKALSPGFG